jgi:hypothetical protein
MNRLVPYDVGENKINTVSYNLLRRAQIFVIGAWVSFVLTVVYSSNTSASAALNITTSSSSGGSCDQRDINFNSNTAGLMFSVSVSVTKSCSSGSKTYYLWGLTSSGDEFTFDYPRITALFVLD